MALIRTRHLSMHPVTSNDLPELYDLAIDGANCVRWILRGSSASLSDFAARIFNPSVVSQMVARSGSDGRAIAHCIAYEGSRHHVKVGVVAAETGRPTGLAAEAMGCFMDFLFLNYPYQKIYIEMLEQRSRIRRHFVWRVVGLVIAFRRRTVATIVERYRTISRVIERLEPTGRNPVHVVARCEAVNEQDWVALPFHRLAVEKRKIETVMAKELHQNIPSASIVAGARQWRICNPGMFYQNAVGNAQLCCGAGLEFEHIADRLAGRHGRF